ncbi:hypothetical protein F5144DRAFT_181772 [Chaetomium tenue]|uniref:Uncharacterized protein n=1 Tax=Chaetomium tenue TaxID=1854479 RepID=A0ACB7PHH0_9PEZI|nr:hypothetical protein F5144DRAFT_181772 [Chaetomium globosum]
MFGLEFHTLGHVIFNWDVMVLFYFAKPDYITRRVVTPSLLTSNGVACRSEFTARPVRSDITYYRGPRPFAVIEFKKRGVIRQAEFRAAIKNTRSPRRGLRWRQRSSLECCFRHRQAGTDEATLNGVDLGLAMLLACPTRGTTRWNAGIGESGGDGWSGAAGCHKTSEMVGW